VDQIARATLFDDQNALKTAILLHISVGLEMATEGECVTQEPSATDEMEPETSQQPTPDPTAPGPEDSEEMPKSCDTEQSPQPESSPEESNDSQAEEAQPEDPPAPVDDFSYLEHDRDTFTGPLREAWDRDQAERQKFEQEEERKQMEMMAANAAADREQFFKDLEAKRQQKKQESTTAPPPAPPPVDPDDLGEGWKRVMDMIKPIQKKPLPEKDAKTVKRLYFSMKG
jgi:hypothetical protein